VKTRNTLAAGLVLVTSATCAAAQWGTNGSKLFYNGGKVGIGVFNPNSKLQVVSAIGAADRPTLLVKMTDTSPEAFNAAIRGTNRGTGFNGIGVWGSHDGSGYGVYGTADDGGYGVYGQATGDGTGGHFTASGANGVGLSGFASAGLGTNYGVIGSSNSGAGFDFFADGAGTDYGSASSRRWKSDIRNIDEPLAKLARLRGVFYTWDKDHGSKHDVGFIAEEVGEVLPEIVQYEANGVDAIGMDYSKLTPLLVEAVNALRAEKDAEIDELRAVNDELRAMLIEMRAEIDAMNSER
jgi:hypothetical protein